MISQVFPLMFYNTIWCLLWVACMGTYNNEDTHTLFLYQPWNTICIPIITEYLTYVYSLYALFLVILHVIIHENINYWCTCMYFYSKIFYSYFFILLCMFSLITFNKYDVMRWSHNTVWKPLDKEALLRKHLTLCGSPPN